jgi:hypothetical protein
MSRPKRSTQALRLMKSGHIIPHLKTNYLFRRASVFHRTQKRLCQRARVC